MILCPEKRGCCGCPVAGWAEGRAYSMKSSLLTTCTPSARRALSGSSTQITAKNRSSETRTGTSRSALTPASASLRNVAAPVPGWFSILMVSAGRLAYPMPASASAVSALASSSAMNATVPSSPRVVEHRIRLTARPAIASHKRASSPGWFFRSTVNTLIWRSSVRGAGQARTSASLSRDDAGTACPDLPPAGSRTCRRAAARPRWLLRHWAPGVRRGATWRWSGLSSLCGPRRYGEHRCRRSVWLRPYWHGPVMARGTGRSVRCPRHVVVTRISRRGTVRIDLEGACLSAGAVRALPGCSAANERRWLICDTRAEPDDGRPVVLSRPRGDLPGDEGQRAEGREDPHVVRSEDPPVGRSAARRSAAAREPAVLAVPAACGNA